MPKLTLPAHRLLSLFFILAVKSSQLPDEPLWIYRGPGSSHPYVLTAAGKQFFGVTKNNLTLTELRILRDAIPISANSTWIPTLINSFKSKEITAEQFIVEFKTAMKRVYLAQFSLAYGGTTLMGPSQYGSVGQMLLSQYTAYMDRFLNQLLANPSGYSAAQLSHRLGLYLNSSSQAFEYGYAASWGLPKNDAWGGRPLPQFAGDGGTRCGSNCGCMWVIEEDLLYWLCYWRLDTKKKHCEDCARLASMYNPLRITKTTVDVLNEIERTY